MTDTIARTTPKFNLTSDEYNKMQEGEVFQIASDIESRLSDLWAIQSTFVRALEYADGSDDALARVIHQKIQELWNVFETLEHKLYDQAAEDCVNFRLKGEKQDCLDAKTNGGSGDYES